ncbi:MAG: hypothetical protein HY791_01335 [Deltaproteobacteria bacterium]|nr:hypothetical protein [Deltaproteobacteria bacterium]
MPPDSERCRAPSSPDSEAFAEDKVFTPASKKEIATVQGRQRPKRRLALLQLEIFAELGLVESTEVDRIKSGRGALDEARDGVACVSIFRQQGTALANRHPFSDAWLQQLADDSNWLLTQLKPVSATQPSAEQSDEAEVRDQLYTELVRRYDEGRKVALEVERARGQLSAPEFARAGGEGRKRVRADSPFASCLTTRQFAQRIVMPGHGCSR